MKPSLLFFFLLLLYFILSSSSVFAIQIDINRATSEQLETLPGIGPKLAQRIIQYREIHGGFKSIEELKQVKGIGDKKFQKIKPYLYIDVNTSKNSSTSFLIYYYKDDKGIIHFTHFPEEVPEKFRNKLKTWK